MADLEAISITVLQEGAIAELVRARRFDDALSSLYEVREKDPHDATIYRAIQIIRDRLLTQGLERLGSLDATPCKRREPTGNLGSDEQYLFDLVRGTASLDELLDASTLGRHRTVRGLVSLLDQGLISLESARTTSHAAHVSLGTPSAAGRHVLVADANTSSATLTRTMLRVVLGGGWSLETCDSAASVLSFVARQRPDLIVIEFSLPGDGLAALRSVRREIGVHIPSIITAQRIEVGFVTARAPERAAVLARPIEKTALLEALSTLGVGGARTRVFG